MQRETKLNKGSKQNMKYYKQEEIQEYIDDNISDYEIDDELHHNLFNTDYYLTYYSECEKWLGSHVFECIRIIQEYEQEQFGEIFTDLGDSEKVVNMYVYIVGEYLLGKMDLEIA